MTDEHGHFVWRGFYKAWGRVEAKTPTQLEQNLRFQGQYYDAETFLHYNTFRYYDPTVGRFTTQDPIGLEGGVNLYRYAPNPTGWVDPLGLAATGDYGQMPTIPGYQKHHNIPQTMQSHPAIAQSQYDIHNSRNITYLPTSEKLDNTRSVHKGKHIKAYDDLVRSQLNEIHSSKASQQIKRMKIQALSENLGEKLRPKKIRLNGAC